MSMDNLNGCELKLRIYVVESMIRMITQEVLMKPKLAEANVIETFKSKYNSLFKAEKKVAEFIINDPHKASLMNVKEIASFTKVSDATVVRMCQHCGYEGFYQMKILLLRDLNDANVADFKDFNEKPIQLFLNRKKGLIDTINSDQNIKHIKDLISLIFRSKIILICAAGNTMPIALDLDFRLNRLGFNAYTSTSNEKLLNYVSNLKKDDLIINISKSGLSKSILQISDIAKRNHVKQVCISSDVDSCLSENAEFTIFSGRLFNDINDSHNGLETHIGEYIVNDVIIAFIISIKMNNNEFIKSQELEYEFFSSLKI